MIEKAPVYITAMEKDVANLIAVDKGGHVWQ